MHMIYQNKRYRGEYWGWSEGKGCDGERCNIAVYVNL